MQLLRAIERVSEGVAATVKPTDHNSHLGEVLGRWFVDGGS